MFRLVKAAALILSLSTAVLILSTQAAVASNDMDEDTRMSLVAFNDAFNAYAEALDVEGMMSLYHEDALWIAPAKPPAEGRDGVPRQTFTFLVENDGEITHTIDYLFVSDDGTQAVMIGGAQGSVESQGVAFKGTYHFTLVRDDAQDDWQIVADMFNQYPLESE